MTHSNRTQRPVETSFHLFVELIICKTKFGTLRVEIEEVVCQNIEYKVECFTIDDNIIYSKFQKSCSKLA